MTLHCGEPGRCGRLGQGQHLGKTGPRGNRGPKVGDRHASAQHDGTEFIQTLGAEDEFPTSAEPIDEFDGARTLDRFLPVLSVDQDVGIDQRPRHVQRPRS